MPTSNDRLSYTDCYVILERAIRDKVGIRLKFSNYGAAMHLRTRLHTARQLARAEGQSEYDPLVLRVREDNGSWLYIERIVPNAIESLTDYEAVEAEPVGAEPKTFIRRI